MAHLPRPGLREARFSAHPVQSRLCILLSTYALSALLPFVPRPLAIRPDPRAAEREVHTNGWTQPSLSPSLRGDQVRFFSSVTDVSDLHSTFGTTPPGTADTQAQQQQQQDEDGVAKVMPLQLSASAVEPPAELRFPKPSSPLPRLGSLPVGLIRQSSPLGHAAGQRRPQTCAGGAGETMPLLAFSCGVPLSDRPRTTSSSSTLPSPKLTPLRGLGMHRRTHSGGGDGARPAFGALPSGSGGGLGALGSHGGPGRDGGGMLADGLLYGGQGYAQVLTVLHESEAAGACASAGNEAPHQLSGLEEEGGAGAGGQRLQSWQLAGQQAAGERRGWRPSEEQRHCLPRPLDRIPANSELEPVQRPDFLQRPDSSGLCANADASPHADGSSGKQLCSSSFDLSSPGGALPNGAQQPGPHAWPRGVTGAHGTHGRQRLRSAAAFLSLGDTPPATPALEPLTRPSTGASLSHSSARLPLYGGGGNGSGNRSGPFPASDPPPFSADQQQQQAAASGRTDALGSPEPSVDPSSGAAHSPRSQRFHEVRSGAAAAAGLVLRCESAEPRCLHLAFDNGSGVGSSARTSGGDAAGGASRQSAGSNGPFSGSGCRECAGGSEASSAAGSHAGGRSAPMSEITHFQLQMMAAPQAPSASATEPLSIAAPDSATGGAHAGSGARASSGSAAEFGDGGAGGDGAQPRSALDGRYVQVFRGTADRFTLANLRPAERVRLRARAGAPVVSRWAPLRIDWGEWSYLEVETDSALPAAPRLQLGAPPPHAPLGTALEVLLSGGLLPDCGPVHSCRIELLPLPPPHPNRAGVADGESVAAVAAGRDDDGARPLELSRPLGSAGQPYDAQLPPAAVVLDRLSPGSRYRVRCALETSKGVGEWSAPLEATTSRATPLAPTPPVVTARTDSTISLAWEPLQPADVALGFRARHYVLHMVELGGGTSDAPSGVAPGPASAASTTSAASGQRSPALGLEPGARGAVVYSGDATSHEVTLLEPARSFAFRLRVVVSAASAVSTGSLSSAWSEPTMATTEAARPAEPLPPYVKEAGADSAELEWRAPADGGQPIAFYKLQVRLAPRSAAGTAAAAQAAGGSAYAGGADGGCVTFGGGGASAAVGSAIGMALASADGPLVAELAVRAPPSQPRSVAAADGSMPAAGPKFEPDVLSATVGSLRSGVAYTARVCAVNAVGAGGWSARSTFVTAPAPPAPMGCPSLLDASEASISVRWDVPAANGSPIVHYELELSPAGSADAGPHLPLAAPPPEPLAEPLRFFFGSSVESAVLEEGLQAGIAYALRARATNRVGAGAWSHPLRVVLAGSDAPPAARTPALVSKTATTIRLRWGRRRRGQAAEQGRSAGSAATDDESESDGGDEANAGKRVRAAAADGAEAAGAGDGSAGVGGAHTGSARALAAAGARLSGGGVRWELQVDRARRIRAVSDGTFLNQREGMGVEEGSHGGGSAESGSMAAMLMANGQALQQHAPSAVLYGRASSAGACTSTGAGGGGLRGSDEIDEEIEGEPDLPESSSRSPAFSADRLATARAAMAADVAADARANGAGAAAGAPPARGCGAAVGASVRQASVVRSRAEAADGRGAGQTVQAGYGSNGDERDDEPAREVSSDSDLDDNDTEQQAAASASLAHTMPLPAVDYSGGGGGNNSNGLARSRPAHPSCQSAAADVVPDKYEATGGGARAPPLSPTSALASGTGDAAPHNDGARSADWTTIYEGAAKTFEAAQLQPACVYRFRVRALARGRAGPWSGPAVCTTDAADTSQRIAFDSLVVHEVLGEGAFSIVYRGECMGEVVAIKKLKYQQMDSETMDKFAKELAIISRAR